jgi:hypothetical protein
MAASPAAAHVPDNRDRTRHLVKPWWFPRFHGRDGRLASPAVTYLVVGLDRSTLTPWHENIRAEDVAAAMRIARSRAGAAGVDLVVAAVLGPDAQVS